MIASLFRFISLIPALLAFAMAACTCQPVYAKTDAEWATDIKIEHVLMDKDSRSPDAPTGALILLLHGSQHCENGTHRAVSFDKATFVAVTGCWSATDTSDTFKLSLDTPKSKAAVEPAYVVMSPDGSQLLILQRGPNGCGDGHGKAFLIDKPHGQVLEGCWDGSDKSTNEFDLTWDNDMKQHIGPLPLELFIIGAPAALPDGIVPKGPQIQSRL